MAAERRARGVELVAVSGQVLDGMARLQAHSSPRRVASPEPGCHPPGSRFIRAVLQLVLPPGAAPARTRRGQFAGGKSISTSSGRVGHTAPSFMRRGALGQHGRAPVTVTNILRARRPPAPSSPRAVMRSSRAQRIDLADEMWAPRRDALAYPPVALAQQHACAAISRLAAGSVARGLPVPCVVKVRSVRDS